MERFGKVAFSIRNLSLEVASHRLVTTLKQSSFSDNLCKKSVGSMDELRQRAFKFMQHEELREFKSKVAEDTDVRRIERKTLQ